MTNQIIEVPDIAVVKTENGEKRLLSLRDQKMQKDAVLHDFGSGSGVMYQGNLYVLDGEVELVRMTTEARTIKFSYNKNNYIVINWGDGQIEVDATRHTYTDELLEHTIILRGTRSDLTGLYCDDMQLTGMILIKMIP